jgi:glucose-6-phosphate 1-dehydrogenase
VEAQWEWIDAIRDAWAAVDMVPQSYTAGSWGPSAAVALIERDGASWHD